MKIGLARGWSGRMASCIAAATMLAWAPSAMAGACRVTDFTKKTLSSLNEVERLSFANQMTQTEFDRLHVLKAGDPNYYDLIAKSPTLLDARRLSRDKLNSLPVRSIDDFRQAWGSDLRRDDIIDALQIDEYSKIWASDFLSDEELRKFADCISARQPGLTVVGRSQSPDMFNITFAHITPIGVEKITTRIVATHNIENIREFTDFLASIGEQDNYVARTFSLKLIDPTKRAVIIIRAGWETPRFIYIPVYPTLEYFK
ncbi:MAG TPA: hypothetical protein VF503_21980 [Sphingobium sp.]|uniref:hypothetical protein n=1 Tax=Sphingobium sp. TaxID=1912891 RepID=UPI002ED35D10